MRPKRSDDLHESPAVDLSTSPPLPDKFLDTLQQVVLYHENSLLLDELPLAYKVVVICDSIRGFIFTLF